VNYEFFDNQDVDSAQSLVEQLQGGTRPLPSRGAPLCSFKQISRQIAGFFDEETLAVEANGSGAPTEAGVMLAQHNGDTAPSYSLQPTSGSGAESTATGSPAVGQPTSANDAPLKTAESDAANPAQPAGGEK
jgi:NADH-quinone oxidoreductase subunit E